MLGLGVDIVDIDRMKKALERTPRIKERVFTEGERWYCEHRRRPEVHYAMRFAAKEAVLKALGSGFSGARFYDVEVTHDDRGRPQAILSGEALARAKKHEMSELALSLSYTHSTAVASALAITDKLEPKVDERVSPQEEILREFKKLRSMLDEELIEAGDEPGDPDDDELVAK